MDAQANHLDLHATQNPASTSSQPPQTAVKRKLEDYFGPSSSAKPRRAFLQPSKTLEDASSSSTNHETTAGAVVDKNATSFSQPSNADTTLEAPAKKFKITASNGHEVVLKMPQKKKRKRAGTKDVGPLSSAKLGVLPSVPLDVLFEIFALLLPLDIIHLARTTKDLRRVLLHRSAACVWKAAMNSVPELPKCPEDVSLPFWANLIFDSHCHNCSKPNVKCVDFILRIRYCNKCANVKLTPLVTYYNQPKIREVLPNVIPFSKWNCRKNRFCKTEDAESVIKELNAFRGKHSDFIQQRQGTVKARRQSAKTAREWHHAYTLQNQSDLEEIWEKREIFIRQKLRDMKYDDELRFLDGVARGVCAIQPQPFIQTLPGHRHVKQPKPLTDTTWAKIEKDMIRLMERVQPLMEQDKHFRIIRKRREMIQEAYVEWRSTDYNLQRFPPHVFMPGPCDIFNFPRIKAFLELPAEPEVKVDIEGKMAVAMEQSLLGWQSGHVHRLWNLASQSRACSGFSWSQFRSVAVPSNLQLAVVVFRCERRWEHCQYEHKRMKDNGSLHQGAKVWHTPDTARCLWFPEYFFHPCNSMTSYSADEEAANEHERLSLDMQYPNIGVRQAEWSSQGLVFDEKASRTTKNILIACGLDPETTSTEDMDNLDLRLVCLKCTFGAKCDGERMVRVWAWRDAVQHSLLKHFGEAGISWECLSPIDTSKAKDLEYYERRKQQYPTPATMKTWKCMRCRGTAEDKGPLNWDGLADHFSRYPSHGDEGDLGNKENVIYYKALDFSPREQPQVKMIPRKSTS